MRERTYISFDWALKRLLRNKANFDVLEGFLTTILSTEIKIHRLLESEGNQEREDAKYNRVDLLAEDGDGELLLIEVQGEPEFAYFQRMLFGASKLVTEYVNGGENYEHVKKVYSINIVYFDLGQGDDVVYHGKTEFRGIHHNDLLKLSPYMKQKFKADEVSQLFPEYIILKVNDFNQWSKVPLDQWLYFLATSDIPDDADAPGLAQARTKLKWMQMSREEQRAYDRYMMDRAILRNTMTTARDEGWEQGMGEGLAQGMEQGLAQGIEQGMAKGMAQGLAQGIEQGMAQGIEQGMAKGIEQGMAKGMEQGMAKGVEQGREERTMEIARKMKSLNLSIADIVDATGLPIEEIERL